MEDGGWSIILGDDDEDEDAELEEESSDFEPEESVVKNKF